MKLRKDSFAARLTPAQKDALFAELAGGLGHDEAAGRVREWIGRKPSASAVSAWFASARVERRYQAAVEVALVAQANCPADYSEQARKALGQARFLATLEDLTPKDIAALEKNTLMERKLALEENRLALDTRVQRMGLLLDRARLVMERTRGGETGEDLQQQIDLALGEIAKLKHGEEAV